MNGAGEGNIIFGDGLENNPDKGIKPNNFDILVANPPYSIKDFTQHLQLKSNTFTLLEKKLIGRNGGEIETLFVERIGQLLKPKGIAAVILPSSILSNDSASYTGAREIILQNFYVRAITAFGSRTFGAAGINTVVMFLERFNEPPKRVSLFMDSVDAIFSRADLTDWQDGEILNEYTKQIKLGPDIYRQFARRELTLAELEANEYFKMYTNAFAAKNIKAKDNDEYLRKFYDYAHEIEREKMLYFALVYQQSTLIITAPADNKEQKDFLGYDWSNRKGNEGIQHTNPGGKLYKDDDRAATGTLAHAVRQTFFDSTSTLTDDQRKYASIVNTRDMLDFSRTSFNKAMRLSVNKVVELSSKYPMKNLFDVATLSRGVSYNKDEQRLNPTSNIVLTADNITLDGRFEVTKQIYVDDSKIFPDDAQLKANDIFICMSSGSKKHVGKVAYIDTDTNYYAGGFMGIIRAKEICISRYLYYVLSDPIMKAILSENSSGANINNLSNKIGTLKIPMPPLTIQQQIVTECEAVDNEYNTTRMKIEDYRKKLLEPCKELENEFPTKRLEDLLIPVTGSLNKIPQEAIKPTGSLPVITQERGSLISGYVDDIVPVTDLPVIVFGDHTCVFKYVDFEFVRGADGTQLLKSDDSIIKLKYLYYYLQTITVTNHDKYERHMKYLKVVNIPVPPLDIQQQIIDKCDAIEEQINEAEKKLESLKGKTAEILKRYL